MWAAAPEPVLQEFITLNREEIVARCAGRHGHDLLLKGFTVSHVVHDYGDVCQTVTELALESNAPIKTSVR